MQEIMKPSWINLLKSEEAKEIAEKAKQSIKSYVESRKNLKELGIIRNELSFQHNYAQWIVKNLLGLETVRTGKAPRYIAVDSQGKTYRIKSRIVKSLRDNTSFDMTDIEPPFDYLIGVFFTPEFEVLGIIQVPYDAVVELCFENSNSVRFRWNKESANDKRVKWIYLA